MSNLSYTVAEIDALLRVADNLDSSNTALGVSLVNGANRVVDSIAALKALPKTGTPKVFVTGYYAAGDGGGGQYYYDSTDTTTADNGGTVIVATDGGRWKLVVTGSVSVKQFGAKGDGVNDDSVAIQNAISSLNDHQCLIFPKCNAVYLISNYINISSKNNFSIDMQGEVKPVGILNNTNSGLFNITSCAYFTITPNIVNELYTSTINCIRLSSCIGGVIKNGRIDVKYNSFDGTAAIQVAANTTNIEIVGNYICSGFGVLGNNGANTSNIKIHHNTFEGQKKYGSTGTGDAIEANYPTNGSSKWFIENNTIYGYEANAPGTGSARIICIGLANVTQFSINGNVIHTSQMEAIHLEDGTSNGEVSHNCISDGVSGITISPNTIRDLRNISVIGNNISLSTYSPLFVVDYGAAILGNVNATNTGKLINISVVGNICDGNNNANRGICLYDVYGFTLTNNVVRNFPRAGYDLRKFAGYGVGISNGTISNNVSDHNGWNYIIGGISGAGPLTNIWFDESNISANSVFGKNYNSEISTRTNSTVRIPYMSNDSNRTLTSGDIIVFPDGTLAPVISSGSGGGVLGDSEITFSKSGSGISNTANITVTFASYSSAWIPVDIELTATAVDVNSANHETVAAEYTARHLTSVAGVAQVGTTRSNSGSTATITPIASGLGLTFTVTFATPSPSIQKKWALVIKVKQPNIHDITLGGVTSIT